MICLSDGKNRVWCEVLDFVMYDGREYAALLQTDDEVPFVLRICEPDGNGKERYETVEDDDIFDKVCAALEAAINGE